MSDAITALSGSSHSVDGPPPPPTGPYDDLLDQATHRLAGDPELQCEVRQELRGHLEDAAAEHRAAGLSEAESRRLAREALGDSAALSLELFQTHRRRLRGRRALKWTLGVALIPAALAITFAVGYSAVLSLGVDSTLQFATERNQDRPLIRAIERLSRISFDRQLADLKPDDRLIAEAAFSADIYRRPLADQAASARRLLARWPRNTVYYAYSASADFRELTFGPKEKPDFAGARAFLDKMDRGEQLEPDNALYNMLKAGVLFQLSSSIVDLDIPRSALPEEEQAAWRGVAIHGLDIHDQAVFDRGLRELRAGWDKPRLTDHEDTLALDFRLIHRPDSLAEMLRMRTYLRSYNGAHGGIMDAEAYALQLARQNPASADPNAIVELLDGALKIARLNATKERPLDYEWRSQEILHYRIGAMRLLGRKDAYAAALAEFATGERRAYELQKTYNIGLYPTALEKAQMDHAEDAVGGRLALGLLLAMLALMATRLLLLALAGKVRDLLVSRTGEANRDMPNPRFIFIGWRRLARICLFAVILPIACHIGWSRATLLWRQDREIAAVLLAVEFFAMMVLIQSLLWRFTRAAVRDRAAELGIALPPSAPLRRGAIRFGILILSVCGVAVVFWPIVWCLNYLSQHHAFGLERWVWVPCAIPLCWIAGSLIGRLQQGGLHRRTGIAVVGVVLSILLLSWSVSDHAISFLLNVGVPLSTFYLIGAACLLTLICSRLLKRLGVMQPGDSESSAGCAAFQRLWPGSALPGLGCAMVLLGLFAGYPLRYIEASAIHKIDAAINASQVHGHDAR